jgi:hypothetical protein
MSQLNQFFDAGDELNKERTSSDFVNQFNKLNEDFSKRINDLDELENKEVAAKGERDEEIDVINNKRKLITQGSREVNE